MLNPSYTRSPCCLRQIRTNSTPPEMSLRLNPVAVRAIAKAVGDNTSLLCLDVSRSSLKDDAGTELAKALKRNTSLCRLDLEYNELGPATAAGLGGAWPACGMGLSWRVVLVVWW